MRKRLLGALLFVALLPVHGVANVVPLREAARISQIERVALHQYSAKMTIALMEGSHTWQTLPLHKAQTFSTLGGAVVAPTLCPNGNIPADGCQNAPVANANTVMHANFLSGYANQTGQTYKTAPTWNYPGGPGYPIGPNNVPIYDAGTYCSACSIAAGVLTLSGTVNGTFAIGENLYGASSTNAGKYFGTITSGSGTSWTLSGSTNSASQDLFVVGNGTVNGGCSYNQAALRVICGPAAAVVLDGYDFTGLTTPSSITLTLSPTGGSSPNCIVRNSKFGYKGTPQSSTAFITANCAGMLSTYNYYVGYPNAPYTLTGFISWNGTGTLESKYDAAIGMRARFVNFAYQVGSTLLIHFDYMEGMVFTGLDSHGEIMQGAADSSTYQYNTFLQPVGAYCANTPSAFTGTIVATALTATGIIGTIIPGSTLIFGAGISANGNAVLSGSPPNFTVATSLNVGPEAMTGTTPCDITAIVAVGFGQNLQTYALVDVDHNVVISNSYNGVPGNNGTGPWLRIASPNTASQTVTFTALIEQQNYVDGTGMGTSGIPTGSCYLGSDWGGSAIIGTWTRSPSGPTANINMLTGNPIPTPGTGQNSC